MSPSPRIIHFPFMHKEFVDEKIRSLALFLNPGLAFDDQSFNPEHLALDQKLSKTFLEQSMQFGRQFKKPSDMALAGVQKEDFYSGSMQSIQHELSTYGSNKEAENQNQRYLQAQQFLLLEYALEERIIELQGIDENLRSTWSDFDKSLGLDEDEEKFLNLDRETSLFKLNTHNWPALLWAFTLFLPENGLLMVSHDLIFPELEEWGVEKHKEYPETYFSEFPTDSTLYSALLKPEKLKSRGLVLKTDVKMLLAASEE